MDIKRLARLCTNPFAIDKSLLFEESFVFQLRNSLDISTARLFYNPVAATHRRYDVSRKRHCTPYSNEILSIERTV